MLNPYTSFINQTLQLVKPIALRHFASVTQIEVKAGDNNQVLTAADLEIGRSIVQAIQQQYPQHNIIDEEAGVIDNNSSVTWVVDPIDGTSNFANGLPTYGIMIGVLEDNKPIAGGIALPYFDETYIGGVGEPATKNNQPIFVSTQPTLLNSLISYGIDGHQENPDITYTETKILAEIILAIRNLRTTNSAYDMAKTIEGKYGLFLNRTTKIWDNVAMQALVEAAGGVCTDFFGKAIDYTSHLQRSNENFTVCMGSPNLHQQMQTLISQHI